MSYLWLLAPLPFVVGFLCGACASDQADTTKDEHARNQMVRDQVEARGVTETAVLQAMRQVPRHEFVPAEYGYLAYTDQPLPIGHGQTISQPYIVGLMSELLQVGPGDTVLEIGTGSGYQAAVLAATVDRVYTIEILEPLATRAEADLARLGYTNVEVRCGDGYQGWKEHAPYDGIIVTAAPPVIPEPLVEQLKTGARMVVPVGEFYQELLVVEKTEAGHKVSRSIPVRFVPMTGDILREPEGGMGEKGDER
jgi:protein-L-isoaspartate(D-aspartate) O-methyltransferase